MVLVQKGLSNLGGHTQRITTLLGKNISILKQSWKIFGNNFHLQAMQSLKILMIKVWQEACMSAEKYPNL